MKLNEQDHVNALLREERLLWNDNITYIAGFDEAGRGCLAGPVVSAAIIFPKDIFIKGVNDSKLLTPAKREKLFTEIKKNALATGIGISYPDEIDTLNIYQATIRSMERALAELSIVPQMLLIDGMLLPNQAIAQKKIIDGDALCYSIAAASIIAKVTRDRLMYEYDKIYPQYGFAQHKGYGTKLHFKTLEQFKPCEIHRKTFNPVTKYYSI